MMGRRLASLALATLLMNAGVIVVGCGNDAGGGHRAAHDGGWTGDTSGAGTVGTSADASMPGAAEAGGLSFADDAATNMSDGGVDAPYSPGETNTEAEASDGSTTDRSDGAVTGDSNAVSMTDGGTDCDAGEDSRVPWQDRDSEADSGLWTPPFDEAQQVVWKTPSADSQGSLPLGNGDIGVNAWLEPNGDVVFYVSKTDAWSAHGRLLKVGRIRVSLPGAGPIMNVLQHLDTKQGEAEFVLGPPDSPTTIRLWVDANVPVVRCEIASDTPQTARVLLESWRTQPRELLPEERDSAYGLIGSSQQIIESIDTILDETNTLMWYHRNEESIWTESLKRQGMGGWSEHGRDPLLHRTFGGLLWGKNFVREDSTSLRSAAAARQQRFALHVLTKQTETVEEWRKAVVALSDEARIDWDVALKAHRTWWREFWERSWIHLPAGDLFDIDQGYLLQRYVTACAGRGFSPIKFNGSIFTVDAQVGTQKLDADYRRWGGAYWFQNTRLIYWPMLPSGDFEMLEPLLRMYREALPFATARTQTYFAHAGAFFPETLYFWGSYPDDVYGWKREGLELGITENTFVRYYYDGALELLAMMLDLYAHNHDERLVRETVLPLAQAVLTFYDLHYPRDSQGRLWLVPAQALETWQTAVNPLPPLAGLHAVLSALLALPPGLASEAERESWGELQAILPEVPKAKQQDGEVLVAAEELLEDALNSENPELYAIFPYRLFGVGKPDLQMARRTFQKRRVKGNDGWRQDDIQAAWLGLAAEASERLRARAKMRNPEQRFPAFWGPNYDWTPDQDHGSNLLLALQAMLLQADGRTITLFPAWPKAWDVEFKLHAPHKTIVQGSFRNGKLEALGVTPVERRADLIIMEPQ